MIFKPKNIEIKGKIAKIDIMEYISSANPTPPHDTQQSTKSGTERQTNPAPKNRQNPAQNTAADHLTDLLLHHF